MPQNPAKTSENPAFHPFCPEAGLPNRFCRFWPLSRRLDRRELTNNNKQLKDKIMANQPFFPTNEGGQIPWFTNIQSRIGGYYTALDINTARQAKITLVLNWLIWTWQVYLPARRQDGPAATHWRAQLATGDASPGLNTMPPDPAALTPPTGVPFFGMLSWLFDEIGRWKKAEGYTDAIGTDLAIIGAGSTPHTDPPLLDQGDVAQNSVSIEFPVFEHDGVWIESLRQGESAMSFLATDTTSPYVDNRPVKTPGQAEWRDYRACWWDGGVPTMNFSPVIRVLVNG
jgi:hypothetical protein